MAKNTTIGSIAVDLKANIASFVTNMNKASTSMTRLGAGIAKNVSSITSKFNLLIGGAAAVAAAIGAKRLIQNFDAAAEKVDELGKAAKRLGIGVGELSALRFAAGEANVEFEQLAKMAGKAARGVAEMVAHGTTTVRLGNLNVGLTNASGEVRNIAELLPDLARGIESAGSEAEQLRLAEKFFGRGGGDAFVQLLRESGSFVENLAVQTERARRLGVIFTDDQVQKLTDYKDAVGRISEAWLGLKVRIMTELAPALTEIANKLASFIAAIPDIWMKVSAVLKRAATDPQLRSALAALGDRFLQLLGDIGVEGGALLVSGIRDALVAGLPLLFSVLKPIAAHAIAAIGEGMAGATEKLAEVGSARGPVAMMWRRGFRDLAEDFREGSDALREEAQGFGKDFVEDLYESIRNADLASPIAAMHGIDTINANVKDLTARLNELFGVQEILAAHSMTNIEGIGKALRGLTGDGGAVDKATIKIKSLSERLHDLGERMRTSIAESAARAGDAFADLALDGKQAFGDLARSFAHMLISMASEQLLFSPLLAHLGNFAGTVFGRLSSAASNSASVPGVPAGYGPPSPYATGGVNMKGGVLSSPTVFPMATGLIAEKRRPEGYFPLARINGDLGVRGIAPSVSVTVIDQRSGGAPPAVSSRTGPDGSTEIRMVLRDEVRRMIGDGSLDKMAGDKWGLRRRGRPR